MRLIHFADVHLGYRAYHRLTPSGINQREQDVQDSFNRALYDIARLKPDLVLMAGDLFHSVRPSNLVLQRTFKALMRFRQECDAPVVMIAGNHESPRSAEAGCILRLFENVPGVVVRDGRYEAVRLPELNAAIFCLPHRSLGELSNLQIEPDPDSRTNLLMLHGTLEGIGHNMYDGLTIHRSQVLGAGWDYIACGHYHLHEKLAENAYYCGSLEYTSFNPWEEVGKGRPPKGFIEYDTETRQVTFHESKVRALRDLPPIHADGLAAAEIMERIQGAAESVKGGLEDKVVRQVVWDVPRKVQVDLDHAKLREIRSQALHFDLSIRLPRPKGFAPAAPTQAVRRTLEQEWSDYVEGYALPAGVEREPFKTLGLEYLSQVSAETVPTDAVEENRETSQAALSLGSENK
ncbi:MAG: exonuclease SbcCD subunit D [Armatimonadetes bacterium]|nr:exonuclease SbcCD subunit D [Armatimonadota bacterium]